MTERPTATVPAWLLEALHELGTTEQPGSASTPRVLGYFREAGHPEVTSDEVPWCAAFASAMLERARVESPRTLRAREFLGWGRAIAEPVLGSIAVLSRGAANGTAGHVGFLLCEQDEALLLIGGNQSDRVTIEAFPRHRLLGLRWPSDAGREPPVVPDDGFAAALEHVLAQEGGWSEDPHDPGGPTNKGITLREFAVWRGETLNPANTAELRAALLAITSDELAALYRTSYWQPACCPALPATVALMHFDAAVNQGVGRAARLLQQALDVEVDGEIGPLTLAAAREQHPARVVEAYASLRRAHYRSLPHFWRFGRGWLARVDRTLACARSLAAEAPMSHSSKETDPMPTETPATTHASDAPPAKWWGRSMTIWGIAVTGLSTVLPVLARAFGVDLPSTLVQQLGDQLLALFQAVTGLAGIVMAILGRFRAVSRLDRRAMTVRI